MLQPAVPLVVTVGLILSAVQTPIAINELNSIMLAQNVVTVKHRTEGPLIQNPFVPRNASVLLPRIVRKDISVPSNSLELLWYQMALAFVSHVPVVVSKIIY